jgi:hypothetical protein
MEQFCGNQVMTEIETDSLLLEANNSKIVYNFEFKSTFLTLYILSYMVRYFKNCVERKKEKRVN